MPWILTDTTTTGDGTEPDPAGVVWKLEMASREIDADVASLSAGALLWMPKRSPRQFVAGPDGLRYLTIHQKRQFLNLMAAG
ncbi:MAG: hypothetical protein WBH51_09480 [Mycolicibacter algericus]|uniref:hypothetical protein n=1 Tax=Mycolicibacter algericus TaxID=1288388 RepID=UPI003C74A271